MCQAFNLVIEKVGDGEIGLIGVAFLLLVWLDRDGVSVNYVRLGGSKFEAIHLGAFIAMKRGWVPDTRLEAEDSEGGLRRECSIYAVNLQKYAVDILQGETSWMKEVTHVSPLSDLTRKEILAAIERSGKAKGI